MAKGFPQEVFARARRVLGRIAAAHAVSDLGAPPTARLEKPAGDRKGDWSVRVNDPYRVTVRFKGQDAVDVKFEDDH